MNEAETRAEYVDLALKAAGWGVVEGSKISREYPFAPGRIEGHGRRAKPLARLHFGALSRQKSRQNGAIIVPSRRLVAYSAAEARRKGPRESIAAVLTTRRNSSALATDKEYTFCSHVL
jgi:hypothetical protein